MDEARIFFDKMWKKQEATALKKEEKKKAALIKRLELEKLIGAKMSILKDPNTVKLKD